MFLYQCDVLTYDKISWEDNNNNLLDNTLEENKSIFDNIVQKLEAEEIDVILKITQIDVNVTRVNY
jgi:hypothetical protein